MFTRLTILAAAVLMAPTSVALAAPVGPSAATSTATITPNQATATPAPTPQHCHAGPRSNRSLLSGSVNLTIKTVPEVPAARFVLDGRLLVTNAKGVASAVVQCTIKVHVLRLVNPRNGEEARYTFVRWFGKLDHEQQNLPTITDLVVRRDLNLQVGFNVSYLLHYAFVDPAGQHFDQTRVSSMIVKSQSGNQQHTQAGGTIRLAGTTVRQGGSGLIAYQVVQRIDSVTIDGSNAVFQGEQKFAPAAVWQKQEQLKITVSVFTAHFIAYPLIGRSAAGKFLKLTYPDGRIVSYPLQQGRLTLSGLVKGVYAVAILSPGATRLVTPFKLSKNQTIPLSVITRRDKIIVGLVVLAIIVLLAYFGRSSYRRYRTRHTYRKRRVHELVEKLRKRATRSSQPDPA